MSLIQYLYISFVSNLATHFAPLLPLYCYSDLAKNLAIGVTGWFIGGKIHSGRAVKKAKKQHAKDQKDLYLKYVRDVGNLQTQVAELEAYATSVMKQKLNDEFLAADLDNNKQVTRAEFEMYKKQYIAKHPEMKNHPFPAFEDFDPDSNGVISMREHENYYAQQGLV